MIDDQFVFIQKWVENFNASAMDPITEPTWLRLYNLPLEYWSKDILSKIDNSVGQTLDIDMGDDDSFFIVLI